MRFSVKSAWRKCTCRSLLLAFQEGSQLKSIRELSRDRSQEGKIVFIKSILSCAIIQKTSHSATIEGFVDVDTDFHPEVMTRVRYLAYATAGQTMTVKLTSRNLERLSLGISGQQDGQVYVAYQVKNNGGEVYLPITQGYYLDVYSTEGKSTAFTLEVTIR